MDAKDDSIPMSAQYRSTADYYRRRMQHKSLPRVRDAIALLQHREALSDNDITLRLIGFENAMREYRRDMNSYHDALAGIECEKIADELRRYGYEI